MKANWKFALAIGMGLPGTILGAFILVSVLDEYIPSWLGLVIILAVVLEMLFLLVRYVLKK